MSGEKGYKGIGIFYLLLAVGVVGWFVGLVGLIGLVGLLGWLTWCGCLGRLAFFRLLDPVEFEVGG